MHWVQLPIHIAIHLSIVNLVGTTPLKKIDSPSPSSYPYPVVSQLGMGFVLTFASHLQPAIWWDLSWKKSCGFCHNTCKFICATAQICLENSVSCSHLPSLVLTAFLSLFCNDPGTLWGGFGIQMSLLGLSIPQSLILYTLTSCRSLC